MTPICPYCGASAKKVTGQTIYPHRQDLSDKVFYQCSPCKAWVGCHKGTDKPLGRLADAKLRQAKQKAHAAFDPLWKTKMQRDNCSKKKARGAGYKWLAGQLKIEIKDCHIGMFTPEQCNLVIEVCQKLRKDNQ